MVAAPQTTKKEMVTTFRTREILAAARRVMEDHGLEAVTMEEIALAAGVAKGTIYLYFSGKDELIQALVYLEAVLATPYWCRVSFTRGGQIHSTAPPTT